MSRPTHSTIVARQYKNCYTTGMSEKQQHRHSTHRRPDHPSVARARKLAHILDSAIDIPFLKKRIGLDPLLGMVPVWGDVVAALLACYLIYVAYELRLPKAVMVRMGGNILLDLLLGALPLVGDVADAMWKANKINYRLLEEAYQRYGCGARSNGQGEIVIDVMAEPA